MRVEKSREAVAQLREAVVKSVEIDAELRSRSIFGHLGKKTVFKIAI